MEFLDTYLKENGFRDEYYAKEEDYEFYLEEIEYFNRLLKENISFNIVIKEKYGYYKKSKLTNGM